VRVSARSHLGRVSEAGLVALVGSHLWFTSLQSAAMFESMVKAYEKETDRGRWLESTGQAVGPGKGAVGKGVPRIGP